VESSCTLSVNALGNETKSTWLERGEGQSSLPSVGDFVSPGGASMLQEQAGPAMTTRKEVGLLQNRNRPPTTTMSNCCSCICKCPRSYCEQKRPADAKHAQVCVHQSACLSTVHAWQDEGPLQCTCSPYTTPGDTVRQVCCVGVKPQKYSSSLVRG
jgi:hypothetical protein